MNMEAISRSCRGGNMGKIDFSMENIKKCLCEKCAVQIESQCVKDKQKLMLLITQQDLDSPMMMGPDRVPGLYCTTGKSNCKDIDTDKVCKCIECPIWNENHLVNEEPGRYFCRDGETR
jgi:hypothetical protein